MTTWNDQKSDKKGKYAEQLVDDWMADKLYYKWKPEDGQHLIDRAYCLPNGEPFWADIKAQARMNNWEETGIKTNHWLTYKQFPKVYLFFVDEMLGKVYGNWLHVLEEPRTVFGIVYPITRNIILRGRPEKRRMYPLCAMNDLFILNQTHINKLKELSDRSYEYEYERKKE
jgi:hypothetical protein